MMTDWPEDFTEKVSALMETLKEGITLVGDAAMEAGRTILAAMWAILPMNCVLTSMAA